MGAFSEVAVLLLICLHSWQAEKLEPGTAPELRVTVSVYNGSNLSSSDLSRAEREAEKIFLYAGIHLAWTAGLLSGDVNDNTPNERWKPTSLQLRIWRRAV